MTMSFPQGFRKNEDYDIIEEELQDEKDFEVLGGRAQGRLHQSFEADPRDQEPMGHDRERDVVEYLKRLSRRRNQNLAATQSYEPTAAQQSWKRGMKRALDFARSGKPNQNAESPSVNATSLNERDEMDMDELWAQSRLKSKSRSMFYPSQ